MEIHLQYIQIDYFTYGFVVDNDRDSDLHVLIVFFLDSSFVIVVRCDDLSTTGIGGFYEENSLRLFFKFL